MIDPPELISTAMQATATIRFLIPREEIQHVMGPAIAEVLEAVSAQGIGPCGAVFSRHFTMQPETFDFEVGVPVSSPVRPVGRVVVSDLPAVASAARTNYRGPYEGLGAGWEAFMEWIISQGHTPTPSLWEHYRTGPESSPDPQTWTTELVRPLLS